MWFSVLLAVSLLAVPPRVATSYHDVATPGQGTPGQVTAGHGTSDNSASHPEAVVSGAGPQSSLAAGAGVVTTGVRLDGVLGSRRVVKSEWLQTPAPRSAGGKSKETSFSGNEHNVKQGVFQDLEIATRKKKTLWGNDKAQGQQQRQQKYTDVTDGPETNRYSFSTKFITTEVFAPDIKRSDDKRNRGLSKKSLSLVGAPSITLSAENTAINVDNDERRTAQERVPSLTFGDVANKVRGQVADNTKTDLSMKSSEGVPIAGQSGLPLMADDSKSSQMNVEIHKIGASRKNSYNIAPKLPKPPDDALGRVDDMGFTTEVTDVILTKLNNVPADSVNVADTSQAVAESSVGASGPLLSSTTGEPSAAAQMFGDVFSEPSVIVEADLPSPFNESARAEGCRCVEHRGGGGFNAGSWTSRQQPLDCRCVGGTGDNVPSDLGDGVVKLTIEKAGIKVIRKNSLQAYREHLQALHLNTVMHLRRLEAGVFDNLTQLREISIQKAPQLEYISEGVLRGLPNLKVLRITHSGLEIVPRMHQLQPMSHVEMIDLDSNRIALLPTGCLSVQAGTLILNHNVIQVVQSHAFNGSTIAELRLRGNRALRTIEEAAFVGLTNLIRIDLSETSLEELPTLGLEGLEVLELRDTPALQRFPSVYHFRYIREAHLTYPYHCCAFQFPETHDPEEHLRFRQGCNHAPAAKPKTQQPGGSVSNFLQRQFSHIAGLLLTESMGPPLSRKPRRDSSKPFGSFTGSSPVRADSRNRSDAPFIDGFFHGEVRPQRNLTVACGALATRSVSCSPAPDAFNPCEDVMGRSWLRAAVWLVLVAALLGNLAVMLVLLSSRFSLSVSKFLMCHLAFADFCMGAYLLLLAAVDAHSAGAYFNHAIPWQHGTGCQVAGFLTVFASELSIFTLTVITLERWYAITYAIHLNRRLKLRTAAKVMTAGWAVAGLAASLPLLGVSSYTKTSICLPMETRGPRDLAYLAALLSGNGLAFLLICACYGKMYASIAGRHASAGDTTVAKRMALLVFTDFACWAPIAFFGLTAVAGYPLIDVTNSKILLVFFYPLNSCANPFLYAILTKQYRRDLFVLLSRYGFCTRRAMRYKDTSSVLHTAPNNRGILLSLQGNHRQGDAVTPAVDTEEETQSSTHRGSPHPIRNSYTKMSSVSQCASIPVDD